MKKTIALIVGVMISLSTNAQETLIYKVSSECIKNVFAEPDREDDSWQVVIELNESEAINFNNFTQNNLGKIFALANGTGHLINLPPSRIYGAFGSKFRAAGFKSKNQATSTISLLMQGGGNCGQSNT